MQNESYFVVTFHVITQKPIVRPLTKQELNRITDQVLRSQMEGRNVFIRKARTADSLQVSLEKENCLS